MNAIDDVRARLEALWTAGDLAAETTKHSHGAVQALTDFYGDLADSQRSLANQTLIQWALSDDERRRFDALALIDQFLIVDALSALRSLANRFEHESQPSSPYSWAKVNRIIGRLAAVENHHDAR